MGACQRQADGEQGPQPKRKSPLSLLDTLVYCGHDHGNWRQYRMRYQYQEGRRPVWRCMHRRDETQGFCGCRMPADVLEEAVWAKLEAISTSSSVVLQDMVKGAAAMAERHARATAVIAKAQAEVRKQQDAAARCRADYYAGDISREDHDRTMALIDARRKAAEDNLAEARAHMELEEPSNLLQSYDDWQHRRGPDL